MQVKRREMVELEIRSGKAYERPFLDVELDATFTSPSGRHCTIPGFYDGEDRWRVRFSPGESGIWRYRTATQYPDADLVSEGQFEVVEPETPARGFLQATPEKFWGLSYESGEPVFVFGDTLYNLFGVAHCGLEWEGLMQRRAEQGFNLIRARVPVSPYHPPEAYSEWQTRSTWPWGGSPQKPNFYQFDLPYFRTVDQVMRRLAELGIGVEMIMEAWGFEYPFNSRNHFLPEHEQLWMRYLVARYDAFASLGMWTLQNEYEFYPDGHWPYNLDADLWAVRTGRYVKSIAPHGHPVAVHNGPRLPTFARRFARAPGVIDLVMFQEWGNRTQEEGWLAAGIEDVIQASLEGWPAAAIFAEWGYERNWALHLKVPSHAGCGPEHTRRGAWRGAFTAHGLIHGFENSWGPWWLPESDQEGMKYLLIVNEFFTRIVEFWHFHPDTEMIEWADAYAPGTRPLALATRARDQLLVYLPVGGSVMLRLPDGVEYEARWFDPRTGALSDPGPHVTGRSELATLPTGQEDWVLVVRRV